MKKYLLSLSILSFGIICSIVLIGQAAAQTATTTLQPQEQKMPGDIQYPIPDLGNCQSKEDCKVYCDNSKNVGPCLAFAEKHNLLSEEELAAAKKFKSAGMVGPGGCKGQEACDEYCGNPDNMEACIAFAEKNNMMPAEKMAEAKKVLAAIKKGVKPPACKGQKECDAYCEDSVHMEECINFGVEAGFMQGKELEDAQKMLAALKKGVKPLPCKGKAACDAYCQTPDNMETCMNFAIEAGMMNEEEKANSQKMLQAIRKGVKPPACKGQAECDAYCQSEEHMEECINFSVAAGMMDEKQAEMAKKTKGKGPGGCKNKEECEAFCNNPDNQETCFQFGKDNGMIPEEELKKMEEGKAQFKETMSNMPQEVKDCLSTVVGSEKVEKFISGAAMPSKEFGDQMKNCFDQFMPKRGQGGPGEGGDMPPGQECKGENCPPSGQKCEGENCSQGQFQPNPGMTNPGGQMMPEQAGPGGCKGPEDCKAFCEKNPEQCKNVQGSLQGQGQPGMMVPKCEGEDCVQKMLQSGPENQQLPGGEAFKNIINRFAPQGQQQMMQGFESECKDGCDQECPGASGTNCINGKCVCYHEQKQSMQMQPGTQGQQMVGQPGQPGQQVENMMAPGTGLPGQGAGMGAGSGQSPVVTEQQQQMMQQIQQQVDQHVQQQMLQVPTTEQIQQQIQQAPPPPSGLPSEGESTQPSGSNQKQSLLGTVMSAFISLFK
ncbi:MAG: hypothetical protein PHN74_02055 [Candidatus Pacebacteria bacterium]|nr:hypothetical protein [Candidatus Paceibacterota bacterium]